MRMYKKDKNIFGEKEKQSEQRKYKKYTLKQKIDILRQLKRARDKRIKDMKTYSPIDDSI